MNELFNTNVDQEDYSIVITPEYSQVLKQLEQALETEYQQNALYRVVKYHNLSETEALFALKEFKKYLIMTTFYKQVPMYSTQADFVWHEMLMFTKEYDKFCQNFVGRKIHHVPEVPGKVVENIEKQEEENFHKRILFEMVYQQLFKVDEYSHYFWGEIYDEVPANIKQIVNGFYKDREDNPLSLKMKADLLNLKVTEEGE